MEKVLKLSKNIWKAMHEMDIDFLSKNVHENCRYVHMGVTLNAKEEEEVIKNRGIVYKNIDVEKVDCIHIGEAYHVYTKLKLTALVGGNEVVNSFVVTEAYTTIDGKLQLISMAYTKIIY